MVHAKVVVTWSMPLNEILKVIGDEQPQIRAGTGGAYRTAIGFIIIISRAQRRERRVTTAGPERAETRDEIGSQPSHTQVSLSSTHICLTATCRHTQIHPNRIAEESNLV